MARSDFTDLKAALAKALGTSARAGSAGLLGPVWREAVGALADHSRPLRLERGLLTVEVSADFLFDLRREQELVRERLSRQLGRGAVREIRLVVAD